ncbi:hypothetical protein [Rodentibacter pneumotropicus]|uniref:hypothetical protein n=1 Tax=Rodentibacter pneumotropicus TaxID=758 RepID=UPI00232F6E4B|nr:hypothetical protein [Rodentibacter pneumotropicus]
MQKSAALVKKGVEKTGVLPNRANSNSKLPIVGKTTGYENQTTRISTGAENVALYPKLKEQLRQENLDNIAKLRPELIHAATGEGNFTFKGKAFTVKEVDELARIWVGDNAIKNSDGSLISLDGTRQFRPPKFKANSVHTVTGMQVNFERGTSVYKDGKFKGFKADSNLHLDVIKED